MKNLFALFVVVLGFSAASFAQPGVNATATASATIVAPLAITKTVDLNFGIAAVDATPGTVVLTPAGVRSRTGGVTLSPANPGAVAAASFTVTGTTGYTYAITLPSTATTVTSGANNMTVTNFTSTPTPTGVLGGSGQIVTVGATLNVGASQVAGVYTSATPFQVTVAYN